MSSLRTAFGDAGAEPVCAGDVRLVSDDVLLLNRPPASPAEHRVVVVATPDVIHEPNITRVLIVPCTTTPQHGGNALLEIPIPIGTSGFTKDAYAITYLVQPVRRDDLQELKGTVDEAILEDIRAAVAYVLGIV